MRTYNLYHLSIRRGAMAYLHYGGPLFMKSIVDTYSDIESERLTFIRFNQPKLRVFSLSYRLLTLVARDT